jgi:glycosyltransferase involved in cell wall biosynthesis
MHSRTPPLVSAITTFLNGERFIAEAIESVLAQTYPNWELFLVDDGSTDGATAIAKSYAGRYPDRIRYLEHEGHRNRGISASRNVGLAAAHGQYIACLDADDVWLPEKLADQVSLLEAQPDVGLMYGNTLYWYSWTGRPEDRARDYYPALGVADGVISGSQLLVWNLRRRVTVPCVHSLLVRADVLRRVGGFEERFTGMFEDQACYAKLFLDGPVLVVNRAWERYRIHDDSCCAVARREGSAASARQRYLEWLDGYLRTAPTAGPEVHAALRNALWPYRHPRLHRLWHGASRFAERVRQRAGRK